MFHPVPRTDRWEPLNAAAAAVILVVWIVVAMLAG
jgi:hypothetical protein